MPSLYILKNRTYLLFIFDKNISLDQLRCVLATSSEIQIDSLAEILHNFLNGDVKMPSALLTRIRKHRKIISGMISEDNKFAKRIGIVRKNINLLVDIISLSSRYVRTVLKKIPDKKK